MDEPFPVTSQINSAAQKMFRLSARLRRYGSAPLRPEASVSAKKRAGIKARPEFLRRQCMSRFW
jgi:hypothetical protein